MAFLFTTLALDGLRRGRRGKKVSNALRPARALLASPPKGQWSEIRASAVSVGEWVTDVVRAIARENPARQGVIDIVDFNATVSGQSILDDGKLWALIEIISRHRLGLNDTEPDILGRAYEYLLRKFAKGQGQSASEFYTPEGTGWLIARLLNPQPGQSADDPT